MKNVDLWKKLASKVIFQNPWITLTQDDVVMPNGKPGTYTTLEAKPFVIVVAIENNSLVMVEQYRYAIKRATLEFPAGGIEAGEDPLAAAKREFQEETGYTAKQWEYVGEFYELVSISRQQGHLFIARELSVVADHDLDQAEISQQFFVTFEELKRKIDSGELLDVLTPAVFYKVQLRVTSRL